jgi:hypothetical protein
MGTTPVLNEVKEQVLDKLTTDSSRKRFPRRKSGIELSIEEFLTVNHKKYPLKITCLEIRVDGFEHSFAVIRGCPLAVVKVCNLIE